jgi:hypothetical protein
MIFWENLSADTLTSYKPLGRAETLAGTLIERDLIVGAAEDYRTKKLSVRCSARRWLHSHWKIMPGRIKENASPLLRAISNG